MSMETEELVKLAGEITQGKWFQGYWGGQCRKESHKYGHPGTRGDDPCVYDPIRYDGGPRISSERGCEVVTTCYDELEISEPDARAISLVPDLLAEVIAFRAANEGWRQNSIDTWASMNAMRNAINEHVPIPSIEGDLLQGPENSIFCATVAGAVIDAVSSLRAQLAAEKALADRLHSALENEVLRSHMPELRESQQSRTAYRKARRL